jgi:hypothetical protein
MAVIERFPFYIGITLHEKHMVLRGLEAKRSDHSGFADRIRETDPELAAYHDKLAGEYDDLLKKFGY